MPTERSGIVAFTYAWRLVGPDHPPALWATDDKPDFLQFVVYGGLSFHTDRDDAPGHLWGPQAMAVTAEMHYRHAWRDKRPFQINTHVDLRGKYTLFPHSLVAGLVVLLDFDESGVSDVWSTVIVNRPGDIDVFKKEISGALGFMQPSQANKKQLGHFSWGAVVQRVRDVTFQYDGPATSKETHHGS